MKKEVYIFIGQSGAGKGTQAGLLQKKIQHLDPVGATFRLETGNAFRDLITKTTFIAKKAKQTIAQGELPPSFLGVHGWSHLLIEGYTGDQHVFIDGTPRVQDEIPALLSVFEYLDWYPHVINIEVSDECSHDRLVRRGREDDREERDVWERIRWFHESVVPALELLKESPRIHYHTVQGEQSIESVHHDICVAVELE